MRRSPHSGSALHRRPRLVLEELEPRLAPSTGPYLHPVGDQTHGLVLPSVLVPVAAKPWLALDGTGEAVLAWQQGPPDAAGAVHVQRFNSLAVSEDPAPIAVTANGWITGLAADGAGDFAVAWTDSTKTDYVRFFSAAGAAEGGPITVATNVQGFPRAGPVLAADPAGHYLVAWDDGNFNAFVQGYDAHGNATGIPVQIVAGSNSTGNATSLAVTADGSGQFVVGWGKGTGYNTDLAAGVFAQHFDAVGDPLANPFQVSAAGGLAVRLAANGAGGLVAVWSIYAQQSDTVPLFRGIAGQRFDDQGHLRGAAFTVDTSAITDALSYYNIAVTPVVAMDSGENVEVAYATANTPGVGNVLYGQRFDASGNAVGPAARLSPLVGAALNNGTALGGLPLSPPALAGDPSGNVVAAWVKADSVGAAVQAEFFTGATSNAAPEVTQPIGDLVAPARVTFQLDLGTFFNDRDGDPITYSLTEAGSIFPPAWLHVTPDGLLWGVPEPGNGYGVGSTDHVQLTTIDPNGGSVSETFTITVGPEPVGRQGGEFSISGQGGPSGVAPVAATSTFGTTLVVWKADAFLMTQLYDANRIAIGNPVIVATLTSTNWLSTPALIADRAGNFVLAWGDVNTANPGNAYSIYLRRFDAHGNPLGAATAVPGTNIPGNGFSGDPHLAANPAGDLLLTWVAGQFQGIEAITLLQNRNAWEMLLDAGGNPVGVPIGLGAGTDWPDIAAASERSALVVWASAAGIQGERFDAAGNPIGGPFPISAVAGSTSPRVVFDASGNYDVVWQGPDAVGTGVWLRRLDASGNPTSPPGQVNSLALFDQAADLPETFGTTTGHSGPVIATDGLGNFVVLWHAGENGSSFPVPGPDGSGLGVFGQRFDTSGQPVGGEFLVNTATAFHQNSPAVAMDAAGNFLAAWASDIVNTGTGIFGQWYTRAPAPTVDGPLTQFAVGTDLVTFSAANGNPITVSDLAGDSTLTALVQTLSGTLFAPNFPVGLISVKGNHTNSLTLTGSLAGVNGALEGLEYQAPIGTSSDFLNVLALVGARSGALGTAIIVENTPDVRPQVSAPTQQTANAAGMIFSTTNGNAIHLSDGNANGATETAYVQTVSGTVTAVSVSGVTATNLTPQLLALSGTVAALNQALDGLHYTPAAGATSDELDVLLNDGTKSGSAAVRSTITADANLAPAITVPGTQSVAAGTVLTFAEGRGNRIAVSDGDSSGGIETVYLQMLSGSELASGGRLTLGDTTVLTQLAGNGTSSVALSGTVAALNRALDGLQYTPPAGVGGGSDWLSLLIDDHGNTGGPPQTASTGVGITIG
jgi:hypothetical protein